MKIGMQTWGSHGDIRPFLALAEGLQAAGHEVHLVITCLDSKIYQGIVSPHGVRITVLPTPTITPEQEMEIGRTVYRTRNPLAQMTEILQLCYAPFEDAMFEAAQKLSTESELMIGHHFLHPLQIAAVQVCGFLDMPNIEVEGKIPEALETFLQAGDAPVCMTFGSWMPRDVAGQTNTLRLFTEAARLTGCRAIVQSPSAQECGFESSDQFLYIPAAPHHAIFPHCSAVVHHGGAGTTQSVTLAGKPSIVVAHISEQENWARELFRLGIAAKPEKRRNVTAEALAEQIKLVRSKSEMAVKAKAVAEAMKKENGVATAVGLIDRISHIDSDGI